MFIRAVEWIIEIAVRAGPLAVVSALLVSLSALTQGVQWTVDTIGKLGPMAVAATVYLTGKRQTRWANQATARAADLEDQKLKLALLDRRVGAVNKLKQSLDHLLNHDAATLEAVRTALKEAEMVFGDREQQELKECLALVESHHNRFLNPLDQNMPTERLGPMVISYDIAKVKIAQVYEHLQNATRIQDVARLVPPK